MDAVFWFGQIFFLMFLVCGIYLSISYAHLADEESARNAKPNSVGTSAAQPRTGDAELIGSH